MDNTSIVILLFLSILCFEIKALEWICQGNEILFDYYAILNLVNLAVLLRRK